MDSQRNRLRQKELFEQFRHELETLQGEARLTAPAEAGKVILKFMEKEQASSVAFYHAGVLKKLDIATKLSKLFGEQCLVLPEPNSGEIDRDTLRGQLKNTDVAISPVNYLVAATGTAVFCNRRHPSRLLTLLPPAVILIASLDTLVPDLWELYRVVEKNRPEQDMALSFYTGPSRTADIEKTLVLGVHGPQKLTVVVVDEGS